MTALDTQGAGPGQERRPAAVYGDCSPTIAGRSCITCSDQAQEVGVLSVDPAAGLALVAAGDTTEQIDISLVDGVAPGDRLLVHGGVALERLA